MAATRTGPGQIGFDRSRQCQPVDYAYIIVCVYLPWCDLDLCLLHTRGDTGLSVDHVHFIASSMLQDGFRSRPAFGRAAIGPRGQPHDIPVLVQGGPSCPLAVQSVADMRAMCRGEPGFPRVSIEPNAGQWYCSLGNGHFTQVNYTLRMYA